MCRLRDRATFSRFTTKQVSPTSITRFGVTLKRRSEFNHLYFAQALILFFIERDKRSCGTLFFRDRSRKRNKTNRPITTNIAFGSSNSIRPDGSCSPVPPPTVRMESILCWPQVWTRQKRSPPRVHITGAAFARG